MKEKYGDDRRTEIIYKAEEFSIEDMIAEEEVVVTISHSGSLKDSRSRVIVGKHGAARVLTGAATREDDLLPICYWQARIIMCLSSPIKDVVIG